MKKILIFALALLSLISVFAFSVVADEVQTEVGDETISVVYLRDEELNWYFEEFAEETQKEHLMWLTWADNFWLNLGISEKYANGQYVYFDFASSLMTENEYNIMPMFHLYYLGSDGEYHNQAYTSGLIRFRCEEQTANNRYVVRVLGGGLDNMLCVFFYDFNVETMFYELNSFRVYDDLGNYETIENITNLQISLYFNLCDIQLRNASSDVALNNMYLFSTIFGYDRKQDFYIREASFVSGWDEGYADGEYVGYNQGYSDGYAEHEDVVGLFGVIVDFIKALFEAPFRLVVSFLDIEVFGINLMWIVAGTFFIGFLAVFIPFVVKIIDLFG